MTEYAPAAIQGVYDRIALGSKQMSGIIGDQAHTYGYHRCRDVLPSHDYSRQLPLDLQGSGQAASALDVSFSPADMQLSTSRLLAAAKAQDSRLRGLREFGGTLDGSTVTSYDLAARHQGTDEWDDSHLWHVHLSFYRAYADDAGTLNPVADVINGGAAPPVDHPSELPQEVEAMLIQSATSHIGALVIGGKAIFVRSGNDYNAMKAGGVPAATVTDALFNNIGAAFGGFRG